MGKPSTTSLKSGTFCSSFRENIDPSRGAAEPTREGIERGVLRKLDLEILASETSAASPSGSPATPEPLEPSVAGGERIVPPTPADGSRSTCGDHVWSQRSGSAIATPRIKACLWCARACGRTNGADNKLNG